MSDEPGNARILVVEDEDGAFLEGLLVVGWEAQTPPVEQVPDAVLAIADQRRRSADLARQMGRQEEYMLSILNSSADAIVFIDNRNQGIGVLGESGRHVGMAIVALEDDRVARRSGQGVVGPADVAVATPLDERMQGEPDKQLSLTDPDARSMATSGKGSGMVGYNVQTAVDVESHLIVAHEVINIGMKWSDTSGHRVKAVKCHNEVSNDNRSEKETELYGRIQA